MAPEVSDRFPLCLGFGEEPTWGHAFGNLGSHLRQWKPCGQEEGGAVHSPMPLIQNTGWSTSCARKEALID